jgi:hypothetical protein
VKKLAEYYHRSPERISEKEVHDYLRFAHEQCYRNSLLGDS